MHHTKIAPARVIPQEKMVSFGLIQENSERAEKECKRQAAAIMRALENGAHIELGKLTFDRRTIRVVPRR